MRQQLALAVAAALPPVASERLQREGEAIKDPGQAISECVTRTQHRSQPPATSKHPPETECV